MASWKMWQIMLYVLMKATIIRFQYIILWFTTFTLQNKSVILFRRVFRYRSLMHFRNVYHLHTLGDICTYIDAEFIERLRKPSSRQPHGNTFNLRFVAGNSWTIGAGHITFCGNGAWTYLHIGCKILFETPHLQTWQWFEPFKLCPTHSP